MSQEPNNIIPINQEQEPAPEVVAAAGASPLESSAESLEQPNASVAGETPAAEQTDLPPPTEANTIDLSKVTFDDLFKDLLQKTKEYAYRLMVTCALLEQIAIRDGKMEDPANAEQKTDA
jgi:hypothetical protein